MLPGFMYDCFWPKIAAQPISPCSALLFARRTSRALPMMHKTVFQWLGPLLFLPMSKATIWRLWSDTENWKQFDVALEYSHLQDDTIGAPL
jgi:hypothetical protein